MACASVCTVIQVVGGLSYDVQIYTIPDYSSVRWSAVCEQRQNSLTEECKLAKEPDNTMIIL